MFITVTDFDIRWGVKQEKASKKKRGGGGYYIYAVVYATVCAIVYAYEACYDEGTTVRSTLFKQAGLLNEGIEWISIQYPRLSCLFQRASSSPWECLEDTCFNLR